MRKCENSVFLETIAAFTLIDGRCRQLIEFMKICVYSRSMSFLDLGPTLEFDLLCELND